MLKGTERRVVILKGDKNAVYDMACIFIKSGGEGCGSTYDDIVKEAEKIINGEAESTKNCDKENERFAKKSVISFMAGALSGCAASFASYFIIYMLFAS